ncbi:MAG: 3-oxoacyl-ACP reductase FabG [Gammaproteobacteria bacterium]|nr:3-oxoacyl-ACP reductase FabG [Gammaproteobacteria bacterium]
MTLAGKTAIVTGASRGIGRGIAAGLADAGAYVLGTATTQGGADGISGMLGESGKGLVLDVASDESVAAFGEAIADGDAPLILVNNAGITRDNLALRMKPEEWQSVIDTNLTAAYRMQRVVLRGMTRARWGRIINIVSVVGSMGNPGQSNYAAAKAGVGGYSRSLAAEVAGRGITVNCIAPGFIATDMTDELDEGTREALLARIPASRLGDPEDVANLVVFLAGDASGYITGETIHVNGGLYMA